jgi:hypothetical protein
VCVFFFWGGILARPPWATAPTGNGGEERVTTLQYYSCLLPQDLVCDICAARAHASFRRRSRQRRRLLLPEGFEHALRVDLRHGRDGSLAHQARKVFGRPKGRKFAHAFMWECRYKRLQLAQLPGQLGIFLTPPCILNLICAQRFSIETTIREIFGTALPGTVGVSHPSSRKVVPISPNALCAGPCTNGAAAAGGADHQSGKVLLASRHDLRTAAGFRQARASATRRCGVRGGPRRSAAAFHRR